MIITNLTLKDWKHLKHVTLSDLAPGINVVYGPNKAGKSTIAEAVRITLVEYEHGSSHRDVKALTPWSSSGSIPTAEVGFVAGGASWRLEKRFSRNRGGGAELRENDASTPKAEGNEATVKARSLLGISRASEGLGGLLWPKQGEANLPEVDQPLGDALRQLLGVQVSEGDLGFQVLLDERLKLWFTPTGRPNREVTNRDQTVQNQRLAVEGLRVSREKCARLVTEHTNKQAEHVAAHKAVEDTRKEIAALEPRVKALNGRKQQINDIKRRQAENAERQRSVQGELDDLRGKMEAMKRAEAKAAEAAKAVEPLKLAADSARTGLDEAAATVTALEPQVQALETRKAQVSAIQQQQTQNANDQKAAANDLSDLKKKAKDAADADKAASEAAIRLEPLKQALVRAEATLEVAHKKVVDAEAADTALRKREARSMALRELADLERTLPGKREAIDQARETEQRLATLRQELAAICPCDETDKERAEQLLNEFREVEAELRAAAVTVTVTPEAEARVGVSADGESRDESLAAGATLDVAVLRDAELRLAGWGTVRVRRGEAAGTLSEQRARRDTLQAEAEALRVKLALGDLERGKWVSELASRAATRESKDKEAKKLAMDLKKQAPDGVEALAAELQREEARLAQGKVGTGLEDSASVVEALAALGDLAAHRDVVDAALRRAREERDAAQVARNTADNEHTRADGNAQELKGKADAARGLLEDAQKRAGGEEVVKKRLDDLAEAARKLTEELDRAQLTEVEKRLSDELKFARETRDGAQMNLDQARAAHQAAVEAHEKAQGEVQVAKAVLDNERMRTGGENALNGKLEALGKAVDKLQEELSGQQLTPEEESLETTLANEREALKAREKREREISERLRTIEGELAQFEGLHGQLAAAEQKLAGMEAARNREILDAEAHKLIDDWFKQERDQATQRSLAPVSEHVQRWIRTLNNADDTCLEFSGSSLKAESLRVGDQDMPVETSTSYGEREQLGTLVRLAYACVLAKDEPQAVILDDPLAHSDSARHRRMLDVLADAGRRNLQIIILTCHPERFDQLPDARRFDLEQAKSGS